MDEYKMPTKQAPVNRLFYGHETNQQYREFLGNNFVYMQEYGLFFKKNCPSNKHWIANLSYTISAKP